MSINTPGRASSPGSINTSGRASSPGSISCVVIGCDLSEPADRALDRAIAIAERHRAKVVLVHAQANDAPIQEVDNAILQQLGEVSAAVRVEEARQLADRLALIEARELEAVCVSRVGPPDEVLAEAAQEHAAQLIVVGTHGSTGITRFLLGSVASSTIRHAACDVLVVRGTGRGLFKKPLVATDFTPASTKAIEHASLVSEATGALDVIHAWQLPAGSWGATMFGAARFPWKTVADAVLTAARGQVDKLVAEHAAQGRTLEVELVQGPPTQVITHAAEKHGHDLIVVGAHGHRGVRRLLLGSVAESTVRHSPCSVLVVHA